MKNFKKLIIDNFQTHRHTEIDFADGITVFVGKTDCGKTSIFRSIKLLLKNKPRGTGFICVFAPKDKKNKPTTTVSLTFEDDTEIKRIRSENINKYILTKEDGTEEHFDNFGVNIPPEILEAIGPNSVKIDTDTFYDINISEQLAPPFLLLDTPSTKTKVIDKVAKIDILNKAIKNNHLKMVNSKSSEKDIEDNITCLENRLKEFEDLEKQKEDLQTLKEKVKQLEDLQNKLFELKQKKELLDSISVSIQKGKEIVNNTNHFLSLTIPKLNSIKEIQTKLDLLLRCKSSYYAIENEIIENKNFINTNSSFNVASQKLINLKQNIANYILLVNIFNQFNTTCFSYNNTRIELEKLGNLGYITKTSQSLINKINLLSSLLSLNEQKKSVEKSLTVAYGYIPEQKQNIEINKQKLKDLLKSLKICPICHSEMTDEKINNIV